MKKFILLYFLFLSIAISKTSAQENTLEVGSIQIKHFSEY
jgi:hypothetical protein